MNLIILWVLLMVAVGAGAWFVGYYSIFLLLAGTALLGYQTLWLQSVELYCDDNGVWVFRGLLPWKRGVIGMKWRDIEVAAFNQNLTSWSTHAYSLQVLDRYTRRAEIVLTDMLHGDQAVTFINTQLNTMIRDKTLVG
jgi:hypothetical protein